MNLPHRSRQGFTLLETLVALAILAIGLTAAMRAVGLSTQSAGDLRDRRLAQWVAANRLAQIRAQALFPETGTSQGEQTQAGERFRWREDIQATPNPLFRRVDVRVFRADAPEGNALVLLTGFAVRPWQ
jgi:general secretion pathway protein I